MNLKKLFPGICAAPALFCAAGLSLTESLPSEVDVTMPRDLNTSFVSVYLNPALRPKPEKILFSNFDVRANPEPYETMSDGVTFSSPRIIGDMMSVRGEYFHKPFVEFIALRDEAISSFELSAISRDLSGSFLDPESGRDLTGVLAGLQSECRNVYSSKFMMNGQNVGFFSCTAASANYFVIMRAGNARIGQTYRYETENYNGQLDHGDARKILIVNYLAKELVNYRNPETTLSDLVVPVNTVNLFLAPSFPKKSEADKAAELKEALAADAALLHARAEDGMKAALFNQKYLLPRRKKNFKPLRINSEKSDIPLFIYNITENIYGNNLITVSDQSAEHVSASTLVTPEILGAESARDLAQKIAADKSCVDNNEIYESTVADLPAFAVVCDNTFDSGRNSREYLLLDVESLMSSRGDDADGAGSKDSVILIMFVGDTTGGEITDTVAANLVFNNLRWEPRLKDMTDLDFEKIREIPTVQAWLAASRTETDPGVWEEFIKNADNALQSRPGASIGEKLAIIADEALLLAGKAK